MMHFNDGESQISIKKILKRDDTARTFILFLLTLSLTGLLAIPYYHPLWGLDFHNLFVFHKCGDNPYFVSGQVCGDMLSRNMYYPPLLYWSFAWTRIFNNYLYASLLWSLAVLIFTMGSLFYWYSAVTSNRLKNILILLALVLQMPLVFSVERGNSDVIVLLTCTLSVFCHSKKQYFLCGILLGLSIAIKIYPVFIAFIFVAYSLNTKSLKSIIAGIIAASAAALFIFLPQNLLYYSEILPVFMNLESGPSLFSHSLVSIVGGFFSKCMFFLLLSIWGFAAFKSEGKEKLVIFSGALAVSTYMAAVSFDYNHLTVLPLLLILFIKASETACISLIRESFFAWIAFLGFRVFPFEMSMAVLGPIFQWAWLCWFGYLVCCSIASNSMGGELAQLFDEEATVAY